MAVGTFTLVNQGKLNILNRTIDFVGSGIAAVLLTTTHTPSVTADSTYGDLTNECADGDYAQVALTTKSITESGGTVTYDADPVSFGTSVSISARYIYLVAGTAGSLTGTDKVMGYMDLSTGGGNVSSTNSTFEVDWHDPNGLLQI